MSEPNPYQQPSWPQQPYEQQPYEQQPGGYGDAATPYGASTPPSPPRRRRWIIPTVLAVLVAAGIVTTVMVLDDSHGGATGGTAVAGKDSGIAACKAIAEDKNLAGDEDDKMSEAEYKQIRKQFADSKDAAIRDNGTKIIDIAWRLQGMSEDDALEALDMLNDLVTAYSGLSGGCAAHGITLPALKPN